MKFTFKQIFNKPCRVEISEAPARQKTSKPAEVQEGIRYSLSGLIRADRLARLFTSVGTLCREAKCPDMLEDAVYGSDMVISAWDGDKLVGLLTAMSDTIHAYGVYFLVDPEYQDQKVGETMFSMFDKHYEGCDKRFRLGEATKYGEKFGYIVNQFGVFKNDLP